MTEPRILSGFVLFSCKPTMVVVLANIATMTGYISVLLVLLSSVVIIDGLELRPPAVIRPFSLVRDIDAMFHILDRAGEEEARINVDGVVFVNVERRASHDGEFL